ncbi:MAG: 4-(cytidine 5'-diphospho)-2-C-methyl-D-erythritol kinase [Chloroflexi bacterium]|nr:4-(cytidine 5'-diphospho)-2-C-methyl-D-erythritol kinase [Chloroflexota bacterium]
MSSLRVKAYAKVNLGLEVLGPRPDGYHEVVTVLQTVSLWDELSVEKAETISLECDDPTLSGPDNLVVRAADAVLQAWGQKAGARIVLNKHIPTAAGLGGGSADAAAALKALSQLWKARMPEETLRAVAGPLGTDVPFFLRGGTALAQGRGERLTYLPPARALRMVLVVPPVFVPDKTRLLYSRLRPEHFSHGGRTKELARSLQAGLPPPEELMVNSFEQVAFQVFTGLEEAWNALERAGGGRVHLTGAGPSIFSLVTDQSAGQEIVARLLREGHRAYLLHVVNPAVTLR